MKSIRHFIAARRVVAASVAACGLTIGLAVGAPAAHAGSGCTWAPISLENGWHSEQGVYGTGDPSVCLEDAGMVYLSGSLAAPSGSSYEFGVLPVWDWPEHNLYFDVYTMDGSFGVLRIDTDGTMWAYGGMGRSSQYTSLAGVSYPDAAVSQADLQLEGGWQSADSQWATGDPAISITSGIVHLSGSMMRPAGPPSASSGGYSAAALPPQAEPSDTDTFATTGYAFGGQIQEVSIISSGSSGGVVFGALNNRYTSLAGINYPTAPTAWQPMPLLNGYTSFGFNGPSYYMSGNVVYLDGWVDLPLGFDGEIAVLPPAERPSHDLYMLAFANGQSSSGYAMLTIDQDGSMWISTAPTGGQSNSVFLAGLSFHLGS
jgi:hypothetical protein